MRRLVMALLSLLGWVEPPGPEPVTGGIGINEPAEVGTDGQADAPEPAAGGAGLRGGRTVERHRFGPPASSNGLGWDTERLVYLDGSTQTVVEETVVRRCDCGVFLSYGNLAKGLCAVCGRVVCSECHATCERCGALCCGTHAVRYGNHTLCSRHRWVLYWLLFWGLIE